MMRVELVYDTDCPNVEHARKALLEGFSLAGLQPSWREWNRESPECPAYIRAYGSPTILVDGSDVAGETGGGGGSSCRLYRGDSGRLGGAPSAEQVANALRDENGPSSGSALRSSLTTVPGIVLAFLPKLACPACWPAYAGLLSSFGLGFLLETSYLLPLTVLFVALAVGALAFRAPTRRGYGPFAVGLVASVAIVLGKFAFESNAAVYGGIGLLVFASVWNAWPKSSKSVGICPRCVQQGPTMSVRSTP